MPHKRIILKTKGKQARDMRKSSYKDSDGRSVSHKMAWIGDPSKKKGEFYAFPSVAPKKGKETSTKKEDWKEQTPDEASKRGELIPFKRKKRAEKFAAGAWKKGKDKREAMKAYRERK